MFDIVDVALSYKRLLIFCSILKDFSKGKGSSFQLIFNAQTAFLLCGADMLLLLIPIMCRFNK